MSRELTARVRLILLSSILFLAAPVGAVEPVSAEQFLNRVSRSHPRLAVAEAEVGVAAASVRAARVWENPTIAYDREEMLGAGRGAAENFFRVELPLEISGRRSLRVEGAERGVDAARAEAAADRVAILADAMRVYWRAAAWRDRLTILEESRAALVGLRDAVRSRALAGDVSGYDLARVEIELTSLDDLIADTERELVAARLRIGAFLGRPGEQLDAADSLASSDLPAVAQSAEQPRLVAARHRVAQHSLDRDAGARGWVPTLTLAGGAKTAPLADETTWGYLAGINLTVPIFDFGQADEQRAGAALERARARLVETEQRTTTDITVAREYFGRALRQAEVFERDQLPRLLDLMRTAELSYKEGERPVFELLDAHRTAREVRVRHITLELRTRLSHIQLLEALGREPGGNR